MWDTLPPNVQSDYERVKEKLKDAFGQKQFLLYIQTCISVRPRQPIESLEVYAADVSRLVTEAFPDYGGAARMGETFRRVLAGLDPALQAKCHEQLATDMEEALPIAGRCERARQALRASTPGLPYSSLHPAVVAALNPASPSVLDCNANATEKLVHAMERLTWRMDNLQTEVRGLRARTVCGGRGSPFPGARQQSPGERREQRRACHCACGGSGCRSTSRDFRMDDSTRGPSPQRRLQGGYGEREWSPREQGTRDTTAGFSPRRLDSEGHREPRFAEER